MKSWLGFFRDKLVEVKEENREEIDTLMTAFESQPYSPRDMLAHLQDIKTNFLQWHIMIANEASTGLYYAQLHNKTCAARKIKNLKEQQGHRESSSVKLGQMAQTLQDLKALEGLSGNWCNRVSQRVQKLNEKVRKDKEEETGSLNEAEQQEQQYVSKDEEGTKDTKEHQEVDASVNEENRVVGLEKSQVQVEGEREESQ